MSPNKRQYAEQKALMKEAFKEATKEWLEEKYEAVGKWTVRGVQAAIVALIVNFIVHADPGALKSVVITTFMKPTEAN